MKLNLFESTPTRLWQKENGCGEISECAGSP